MIHISLLSFECQKSTLAFCNDFLMTSFSRLGPLRNLFNQQTKKTKPWLLKPDSIHSYLNSIYSKSSKLISQSSSYFPHLSAESWKHHSWDCPTPSKGTGHLRWVVDYKSKSPGRLRANTNKLAKLKLLISIKRSLHLSVNMFLSRCSLSQEGQGHVCQEKGL